MLTLSYRQVHLDFHTSPHISGVGAAFDRQEWQERLQEAGVSSITCFSCCHHGLSYHPTRVGQMHPGLDFDLLRAQMEASHAKGIRVPVYVTGGLNNVAAAQHPEWREMNSEGRYSGWSASPLEPGFKKLCFNTPYLDYLCRLLEETVTLFPEADGVFIDIVHQGECCCERCLADMRRLGYDPAVAADRRRFARQVLLRYYERSTSAVRCRDSGMPIFHNQGHAAYDRETHRYCSHLELESLPTGGWGYDHFPLSAGLGRQSGLDCLGMTGKFHTTWGEFGGFKHPNALRYECAATLAHGAKCSIGDQLHPNGRLDAGTCRLIGSAYSEVAAKEPWCAGAVSAATVAVLSNSAWAWHGGEMADPAALPAETGVCRLLLDCHIPFDLLLPGSDFSPYKALILADDWRLTPAMAEQLQGYVRRGGKLILSGRAGFAVDRDSFALPVPVRHEGESPVGPDYVRAAAALVPDYLQTPFVMYARSQRIVLTDGESLGEIYDPYFMRSGEHFCSHQHSPNRPEPSGYAAGVLAGSMLYFAHPVFTLYYAGGSVALKSYISGAIRALLGEDEQVRTTLPSTGRLTLMHQPESGRHVLHLLYAAFALRGHAHPAAFVHGRDSQAVEIIEDVPALHGVQVSLRLPRAISRVTLEPQGAELPFTLAGGRLHLEIASFSCHQMVVLHEAR